MAGPERRSAGVRAQPALRQQAVQQLPIARSVDIASVTIWDSST
jgi:hypothetical protein